MTRAKKTTWGWMHLVVGTTATCTLVVLVLLVAEMRWGGSEPAPAASTQPERHGDRTLSDDATASRDATRPSRPKISTADGDADWLNEVVTDVVSRHTSATGLKTVSEVQPPPRRYIAETELPEPVPPPEPMTNRPPERNPGGVNGERPPRPPPARTVRGGR